MSRPPRNNKRGHTFLIILLIFCTQFCHAEKITVWGMGEEGIRIHKMARKFEAQNPGAQVITQAIPWGAAHEKLLTAVVGGLPPDISQMGTTWMAEFATLKALEPLEEYIRESPVIKKEKFFEGSWETCVMNSTVYGIPWYVDTRVLFYRKDLLEEAGFRNPPQTWEELMKACLLLKRDGARDGKMSRYGINLPVKDWGSLLPFVWQNSGDVFHASDPRFEEAVRFYLEFFRENVSPMTSKDVDHYQAFKNGIYPMFISGPWMVEGTNKEIPEIKGKWAVSVLPKKKNRTSFIGGCNLVLFKQSKQKDLAWKFIEFMSQPQNQLEWYGIVKALPSLREAWKDQSMQSDPHLKVFGDQLNDTRSPPVIPEWEKIAYAIDLKMEEIMFQDRSLDDSIHEKLVSLEKEINAILEKGHQRKNVKVHFIYFLAILAIVITALYALRRKIFYGVHKSTSDKSKRSKEGVVMTVRKSIWGFLFIMPAIIILFTFLLLPTLISFFISLTDWNIYGLADWNRVTFTGIENYKAVLRDPIFWKSLWNTLLFAGVGVPLTIMIALLFATILNEKFVRMRTLFRVAYFTPVVTSIVAVGVVWRWLYSSDEYGLLNWFLKIFSLPGISWLGDSKTALASLILMAVWKNFGYNMIIFLAGLQTISQNLFESARIDGANEWQCFRHITLPGLRPTMLFVIVITTIGYLQFFAEAYVMTEGGPQNSTMSIMLYMYQRGFKYFDLGYASAIAYILFGLIFVFTLLQIKLRKSDFAVN